MIKIKCIIVDDEATAREVLQILIRQIEDLEIMAFCKNATEAFDALQKHPVDLIFLDINMPDRSGISLAKSISKSTKIIFTTAYRKYAVDGFDLQAVDYLLKPISLARLRQAIKKYSVENSKNEDPVDYLVIRSDRKMVKINFGDIVHIESLSDYIKIHTTEKTIITRETISKIESKLQKNDFIRIHRSFIVSVAFIDSYTSEFVEIKKKTLPISRTYRSSFIDRIEKR